nr:uncharacterized protein LOC117606350 [Osmia lignaria]
MTHSRQLIQSKNEIFTLFRKATLSQVKGVHPPKRLFSPTNTSRWERPPPPSSLLRDNIKNPIKMCFALNLLIFILLSPTNFILQAKNLEEIQNPPNDEEKSAVKFFEESNEDQFSLVSTTTTESTTTIETYSKLTFAIADDNNDSREFKPSIHLGEIKESRISSPFNNVHHIRFENEVDPVSYHQLNNLGVVYQPALQADHQEALQGYPENVGSLDEDRREGLQQNVYVKFQDQSVDVPKVYYGELLKNQGHHHQSTGNVGAQYDLIDPQAFQNLEKPVNEQNVKNYLGKPSKFQSGPQKQELEGFSNSDPSRNQYYPGYYDQQAYQQNVHDLDAFKRPHDGAVYVQESSFTRTKKFPYPFHQPPVGYHQVEMVNDHRTSYPVRERVSPWKKILHLIGAFLPIGLLVAALTPNIVKVNNTTDPNIVLSKWRVADLPAEHKQARISESSIICEKRSICEVILTGGEAGSNALQNILWNLATRTSTKIAEECGLQEIFEAVKKKDCTTIIC